MGTATHIVLGDSAPTDRPPSVGAHYINVPDRLMWYAVGTQTIGDWAGPLLFAKSPYKASLSDQQLEIVQDAPYYEWRIDAGMSRTINLPNLQLTELLEVTVVVDNVDSVDITIVPNTGYGLRLIGGDLLVPAGKVVLFRLAFFPGRLNWALTQSLVIGD